MTLKHVAVIAGVMLALGCGGSGGMNGGGSAGGGSAGGGSAGGGSVGGGSAGGGDAGGGSAGGGDAGGGSAGGGDAGGGSAGGGDAGGGSAGGGSVGGGSAGGGSVGGGSAGGGSAGGGSVGGGSAGGGSAGGGSAGGGSVGGGSAGGGSAGGGSVGGGSAGGGSAGGGSAGGGSAGGGSAGGGSAGGGSAGGGSVGGGSAGGGSAGGGSAGGSLGTNEIEPNDTCANASTNGAIALTAVNTPKRVAANISLSGELDWFAFSVPNFADVRLETFDTSGLGTCTSVDTIVDLVAADCLTQLAADDNTGVNQCSLIDPQTLAGARHLAGGTYFARVRPVSNTATFGYALDLRMTALCGNGTKEGSEECDGTAGCRTDCLLTPVCGNGTKTALEQCDDGNILNDDGCSSSCAYEITPEAETNNVCSMANGPTTLGVRGSYKLFSGAISPAADTDWYRFTVTAISDVAFETFDQNGPGTCQSIDTTMQLFANDCTSTLTPVSDETGINSCSLIEPSTDGAVRQLAPGTYNLRVAAYSSTAVFGYRLQARVVARCGDGQVNGYEQCDGSAGCTASCTFTPMCGNDRIEVGEQCDDANTANGDGCSAACAWETTAEVEPNGTTAEATAATVQLSGAVRITGALPLNDADLFRLTVASPQVYRFELFDASGKDCPASGTTTLTLLSAAGTDLKTDTLSSGIGACPALVVPVEAGTYFLRLRANASTTTLGSYHLEVKPVASGGVEVEPNETQATANALSGREVFVFGGRMTAGDLDTFTISVPPNAKSIRAEIVEGDALETCESNDIDSHLTLLSPSGATLVTNDDAGRGFCSLIDGTGNTPVNALAHDLPTGQYALQVRASTSAQGTMAQFNYRLVVTIRH